MAVSDGSSSSTAALLPPATEGMMLMRVAVLDRRPFLLQVADVLVVHVDVHEAPEPALIRVEVLLEPVELTREVGEQLANGCA